MISSGWGTWIRTKINGVRVRCSTIELFPNRSRVPGERGFGPGPSIEGEPQINRAAAYKVRVSRGLPPLSVQAIFLRIFLAPAEKRPSLLFSCKNS